ACRGRLLISEAAAERDGAGASGVWWSKQLSKGPSMRKLPLLALVLLFIAAAPAASLAQPELKTEEQKTLYALGLVIAQNLSSFALSPADLEIVKAGIADGVTSRAP